MYRGDQPLFHSFILYFYLLISDFFKLCSPSCSHVFVGLPSHLLPPGSYSITSYITDPGLVLHTCPSIWLCVVYFSILYRQLPLAKVLLLYSISLRFLDSSIVLIIFIEYRVQFYFQL